MAVAGSSGDASQLAGSVGDERRADTVAEQWRLRLWCRSSDCQHLVHILLSQRREPRLSQILAIVVPAFLILNRKDAFLEAVASQNLLDQILQTAVIEFLATWRLPTYACLSDLEADPQIAAAADQLLPESLTLLEWLERRMQPDIILYGDGNTASVHIIQHAKPLVTTAYKRLKRRQPQA